MTTLELVVSVGGAFALFTWTASLVTGDVSWTDRSWSIAPVIYAWIFAGAAHLRSARLDDVAVLVTLWGVRLTYNFARRGGYAGVEDYRWAVLRARMSRVQFQLFNVAFISFYQNVLLVLITLPLEVVLDHRHQSFGPLDVLCTVLFIGATIGETVADQQQWRFQETKRQLVAAGADVASPFLHDGLFRFSRHPNYFFEVAQWWVVAAFGAVAARSLTPFTWLGAVLLTLLFVGSTRFTESLTLAKYPSYAHFRRTTPAVIPFTKWRGRE